MCREMQGPNAAVVSVTDGSAAHDGDAERTLAAVVEAVGDGVLTLDAEGRVGTVNRAAAAMFRCPPERLVGIHWRLVLDAPAETVPEPGRARELAGRRADGTTFPAECTFVRVELERGGTIVCVVRDLAERRLLERRVVEARDQLQRQIGQDLHDGLGQILTGTAFLAKGLVARVAPDDQAQAQRVVELLNLAITRVRGLARGLAIFHLDGQSLEDVLGDAAAESAKLLGVDCRFELRDRIDLDRAPPMIAQLYLIVREAVTNAVRHGKADRIVVRLSRQDDQVVVDIEDNGVGLGEPHELREGLGLRGMRERAALLGGTLEIGRATAGTLIRCVFPR